MNHWLQHLLVLALVAACLTFVARQAFAGLRGRKSKLGSCCAKGCEPPSNPASTTRPEKIVFLPVEMLRKHK